MRTARRLRAAAVALASLLSVLFFCGFLVLDALAQPAPQFVPLVDLPQLSNTSGGGLAGYFNQLYMVCVAVGAIIAFIKISIAGVKWSMSDVVTSKGEAKEDIKGALLGLIILLIPFIVLNTIYPRLTSLNILQNADRVRINTSAGGGSNPSGVTSEQSIQNVTQESGAALNGTVPTTRQWNCPITARGVCQGDPQFGGTCTADERDCSSLVSLCQSSDCNRGTVSYLNSGQTVRCTYYITIDGTAAGQVNAQPDNCRP